MELSGVGIEDISAANLISIILFKSAALFCAFCLTFRFAVCCVSCCTSCCASMEGRTCAVPVYIVYGGTRLDIVAVDTEG